MSDLTHDVYWYSLKKPKPTPLTGDLSLDVAIIGGGVAGLMCAQKLKILNKNLKIAVIESTVCGGGASGRSSGFITPDSELELSDMVREYGKEDGKKIWEFGKAGVQSIRSTIEQRNLPCDYSPQDSLFIANNAKGFAKVKKEFEIQKELGYKASLYNAETLPEIIGSKKYCGGVETKDTFGIISFLFCQELKDSLIRDGISIYEESPVDEITPAGIRAGAFTITAEKVVVCTDQFLPRLKLAEQEVYHAQTFLGVSKPLPLEVVHQLFPQGPRMVWDTDLIYQYYRIVQGNRLLIGAANVLYTYTPLKARVPARVTKKMYTYLKSTFPDVDIELEYTWPGLIGVSKDFLPIVGRDPVLKNVYFTGACAGLPWAAGLGEYLAEKIFTGRDEFDILFSPTRKFPIPNTVQFVVSKPVSFAISHGIKKYFA